MNSILYFVLLLFLQNNCGKTEVKNVNQTNTTPQNVVTMPMQENKTVDDKENLAQRLEKVDVDSANIIRNADSKLKQLSTPFFRVGKIYRVSQSLTTRPLVIFIGIDEKDFAAVLNANPDGYFELAKKSELVLETRDLKLDYAKTFLETVESKNKRLLILQNVKDIKERPNLDETKKKEFVAFQSKYEKIIVPPYVNDSIPYEATFFVVKKQDLVRLDLYVSADGKIEIKDTVLEKNILIPYAL